MNKTIKRALLLLPILGLLSNHVLADVENGVIENFLVGNTGLNLNPNATGNVSLTIKCGDFPETDITGLNYYMFSNSNWSKSQGINCYLEYKPQGWFSTRMSLYYAPGGHAEIFSKTIPAKFLEPVKGDANVVLGIAYIKTAGGPNQTNSLCEAGGVLQVLNPGTGDGSSVDIGGQGLC